jgi:hypothetical protein
MIFIQWNQLQRVEEACAAHGENGARSRRHLRRKCRRAREMFQQNQRLFARRTYGTLPKSWFESLGPLVQVQTE